MLFSVSRLFYRLPSPWPTTLPIFNLAARLVHPNARCIALAKGSSRGDLYTIFFSSSTLIWFGFCSSLVFNALCKGTFTVGRQHLHFTSHLTSILSSPFNCNPLLLCLPCILSLLNSARFNYLAVATWPPPHSPLQLSDPEPFAGSRERSCVPCPQLPPKRCQAKCWILLIFHCKCHLLGH